MTHQLTEELEKILAKGDYYFESLGQGRYRSSLHAQGAWNEHEQRHGSGVRNLGLRTGKLSAS